MKKFKNIDEAFKALANQEQANKEITVDVNIDTYIEDAISYIPYEDINTCCPQSCMSCLMDAIEIVESGDWQNPNSTNPLTRCDRTTGTMHGHYQIGAGMIDDARSLCKGGGGLPKVPTCCNIPNNAYTIISTPCNGDAECCLAKKNLGQLIVDCWRRRWTRNQGKGSCGWSKCDGSGGESQNEPGRHCYTCEDLAKMHKEGVCGHKCCEAPGCCAEVGELQQEAEGGDACGRANQYWNRVKSVMDQICPNCEGVEIETEDTIHGCSCVINGKGYDLTEEECLEAGGQCKSTEVLQKEI